MKAVQDGAETVSDSTREGKDKMYAAFLGGTKEEREYGVLRCLDCVMLGQYLKCR